MTQTIKEVLDENTILRFSRIPVYEENIDNVRVWSSVQKY